MGVLMGVAIGMKEIPRPSSRSGMGEPVLLPPKYPSTMTSARPATFVSIPAAGRIPLVPVPVQPAPVPQIPAYLTELPASREQSHAGPALPLVPLQMKEMAPRPPSILGMDGPVLLPPKYPSTMASARPVTFVSIPAEGQMLEVTFPQMPAPLAELPVPWEQNPIGPAVQPVPLQIPAPRFTCVEDVRSFPPEVKTYLPRIQRARGGDPLFIKPISRAIDDFLMFKFIGNFSVAVCEKLLGCHYGDIRKSISIIRETFPYLEDFLRSIRTYDQEKCIPANSRVMPVSHPAKLLAGLGLNADEQERTALNSFTAARTGARLGMQVGFLATTLAEFVNDSIYMPKINDIKIPYEERLLIADELMIATRYVLGLGLGSSFVVFPAIAGLIWRGFLTTSPNNHEAARKYMSLISGESEYSNLNVFDKNSMIRLIGKVQAYIKYEAALSPAEAELNKAECGGRTSALSCISEIARHFERIKTASCGKCKGSCCCGFIFGRDFSIPNTIIRLGLVNMLGELAKSHTDSLVAGNALSLLMEQARDSNSDRIAWLFANSKLASLNAQPGGAWRNIWSRTLDYVLDFGFMSFKSLGGFIAWLSNL